MASVTTNHCEHYLNTVENGKDISLQFHINQIKYSGKPLVKALNAAFVSFQMVWEQGVVVIVNLTKLSDLGLVGSS